MDTIAGTTSLGIQLVLLIGTKAFTPPWISHVGFTFLAKILIDNVDVEFHEFDESFLQKQ